MNSVECPGRLETGPEQENVNQADRSDLPAFDDTREVFMLQKLEAMNAAWTPRWKRRGKEKAISAQNPERSGKGGGFAPPVKAMGEETGLSCKELVAILPPLRSASPRVAPAMHAREQGCSRVETVERKAKGCHLPASGSPAALTSSRVLGNENLRPSSSMTLTWQMYGPGFRSSNEIRNLTGRTLSRLGSN